MFKVIISLRYCYGNIKLLLFAIWYKYNRLNKGSDKCTSTAIFNRFVNVVTLQATKVLNNPIANRKHQVHPTASEYTANILHNINIKR